MTAISPTPNATALTAPIALPDSPMRRSRGRRDESLWDATPHAAAQLAAAIVSTSLLWLAAAIVLAGYLWPVLPIVLLAVAIFAGAVLPDVLAARWDAQRAAEDAEDAA